MATSVRHVRRSGTLAGFALLGLASLLAFTPALQGSAPWAGPIPAAPGEREDPARHLPVRFTVTERAGVTRPDGLVEAGVPLAQGEVHEPIRLTVSEGDRPLASSFTPLAWWPDGSIRWAKMTLPVTLAAGERKTLTLAKGNGPRIETKPPRWPQMMLRLVTAEDEVAFPVRSRGRMTRGDHGVDLEVDVLTPRRLQVGVQVSQLAGNTFWKSLTFEVADTGPVTLERGRGAIAGGTWCAAIRCAAERGPKEVEAGDGKLLLHLYPPTAPPYPADRGFHVTHTIVLERGVTPGDLAQRVAWPLRPAWPPRYVHATRAMGRTGVAGEPDDGLDRSFAECWKRIRAQQALPANRGWTAWGDFFDRAHGAAYSGYLNQEYDPATAFFLYHARSGDANALDTALDMACQYADNSVSLRGGCYQHRATWHAIQGHIARAVALRLRRRWRRSPDVPLRGSEVIAYAARNYGPKAARGVAELEQGITAADPAAGEKLLSEQIAYALVRQAEFRMKEDRALIARLRARYGERFESAALFREMAEYLLAAPDVKTFGLPGVDELFAPFFARYGGSWDDFPAFHFYDLSIEKYTHQGGHSLAEMLVWGSLWSGDVFLRQAALRVARHHVESGLVQRGIQTVAGALEAGNLVFARDVGWPLVNLLALELLTERAEPELDAQLKQAIREMVASILTIPPDRYQGAIHVGVVSEGLARYHERTGDPEARKYLVRLMRYWAATQWNAGRQAFYYVKDQPEPAWPELSAFSAYGLTYAAWQSGDQRLIDRARQVLAGACRNHPDYVKSFAQQFHNSPRAAALLPLLGPPAPE